MKGCSEKFVKGGGVSYFRISSKPEMQRNAWILALKRNGWTPKAHHRICSRHFVTGESVFSLFDLIACRRYKYVDEVGYCVVVLVKRP